MSILVIFCMQSTGCFSDEYVSDWEYEHYYYVEIQNSSTEDYTLIVPLPSSSNEYFDNYIDNLKVEKGNCVFKVIEYNSNKYLQIKGSSFVTISSSFKIWDDLADITIEKETPHRTMIYSNSINISLMIDSRVVKKTNEEDYWYFYYSATINPNMNYPIPTIQTWKDHLSNDYFIQLQTEWYSYSINEEVWNGIKIR